MNTTMRVDKKEKGRKGGLTRFFFPVLILNRNNKERKPGQVAPEKETAVFIIFSFYGRKNNLTKSMTLPSKKEERKGACHVHFIDLIDGSISTQLNPLSNFTVKVFYNISIHTHTYIYA
ncbi:hypothetical protein HMI55_002505 [Coelomomyces lativittatus]|nr:hypothetical protein HMI55_002505 [Coelomomyces lativittatus]